MHYVDFSRYNDYINPFKYDLKRIIECYKNEEKFSFRFESLLNEACKENKYFREAYLNFILKADFTSRQLFFLNYIDNHTVKENHSSLVKAKYTIKQILDDHWDSYLPFITKYCDIPNYVIENVEKIRICRTKELGYDVYTCPKCGNTMFNFHTCKSRFCSSCGVKYAKQRTIEIQKKVFNCHHRHIVFTIPEEIREYFKKDKNLLNNLFSSANNVIQYLFNGRRENKRVDKSNAYYITPGFISVIHTFGRDLKWNPHVHMLISEGGFDSRSSSFTNFNFFDYNLLRKSWQKCILDALTIKLGKSFYPLKCMLYKKKDNGFYVYAHNEQFNDTKKGIEYVVRYTGRPVMSESRITDYNGETVTWFYHPHEDESKTIVVKDKVYNFISKIIKHIPPKQFKMVRYYGAYAAKNHKYRLCKDKAYNNIEIVKNQKLIQWRNSIIYNFKYDKLECNNCNTLMELDYSIHIIRKNGEKVNEIFQSYKKAEYHPVSWQERTRYCPTYS